jgi:sarcosine oxidase subunit gamma
MLGFAVPAAHRWLEQGGWTACWIGPSAWQITHAGPIGDYEGRRDALIAAGGALFDVSDARAAIRVAGAGARELLASGCGIDFDAAAFPAGECRSTLFARIGVLIVKHDETPSYTLFVPRSYAASLFGWLAYS